MSSISETGSLMAMRRTPLYEAHVALGGKMVPFGGWAMPLHYGSQLEEHQITRTAVGLFDVSHMGQVEIIGSDALQLAQEIVTNDLSKMRDGDEIYSAMCNEDGGLIDDLIVTKFTNDHYMLVVNASTYEGDLAHMQQIGYRLALEDADIIPAADRWAMIAVQGPEFEEVSLAVLGEGPWEQLAPFKAARIYRNGCEMIISRTGYTGEPGIEILCPPDDAMPLWEALIEAGGRPCGLAARDTLRLEKGYCLSGQDFTSKENPFEAGLGWVVKMNKPSFCGREALAKAQADGIRKRLVGLLPDGRRMARHGAAITAGSGTIGEVTSGGYSPSLERPIALGYVITEFSKPGTEVQVSVGTGTSRTVVTKPPFLK